MLLLLVLFSSLFGSSSCARLTAMLLGVSMDREAGLGRGGRGGESGALFARGVQERDTEGLRGVLLLRGVRGVRWVEVDFTGVDLGTEDVRGVEEVALGGVCW
jgi:hypothetical protein